MNNKMNKYVKKLVIFTLSIFLFVGIVNVKAGYTYDSKGEPIYSTEGFTVNELPYTYSGLKIGESKKNKLNSEIEVLNSEIEKLTADSKAIDEEVKTLNAEYIEKDLETKIKNLEEKVDAKEKEIASADVDKLEELNEQLKVLQDELKPLNDKWDAMTDAEKTQLSSELKAITDEVAELKVQKTVLETKKSNAQSRIKVLNTRSVDVSQAKPVDLFVFNLDDEEDENNLLPQELYLTDSKLNMVTILDTNFQVVEELFKFKLVPEDLFSPNFSAIKTLDDSGKSGVLIEASSSSNTFYDENGYYELELNSPTSAYRSITSILKDEDGDGVKDVITLDLLYICDKGNNQIVILDYSAKDQETGLYKVYQVLTKPTDELDSTKAFAPQKVVTDDKRRMYVIADNITQGIMQFSEQGQFQRYTGKNDITLNAWEIFWRNLASESQLDSQSSNYNTTFNSMVYSDAMIYTTSFSITNTDGTINDKIMIKRINPSGGDTLARNGYKVPMGDVKYSNSTDRDKSEKGPSQLVGITVNGYQVYSVVDQLRGRIFTYDKEGNLLYISGSNNGTQADKLNIPVAIQYFGEDLLVLDQKNLAIVKFEPTEIAKLINEAVKLDNIGRRMRIEPSFNPETESWWINKVDTGIKDKTLNYEAKTVDGKLVWFIGETNTKVEVELGSSDYWEQVVALNANYEYGYVGIGHRYLEDEKFEEAMRYFELGKNKVYYSKAYKQYRDGIIKKWFSPVLITIAVLICGNYTYKYIKNKKLGIKKQEETGVGDE